MNNKMIEKCIECGQDYCQECTCDMRGWQNYCSEKCRDEHETRETSQE